MIVRTEQANRLLVAHECHPPSEGGAPRDAQFDLGARSRAAADREAPADACGALLHAGDAPVAGGSRARDLRIDAPAVVSHEQPQLARSVFDLNLDRRGARMAERVHQSLAADPVYVVSHRGIEQPGLAFHDDTIRRRLSGRQLALDAGERVLEIVSLAARAKAADGVAPFLDHAAHQIEHAGERGFRRRVLRQAIHGDVHLHRRADEPLQQRVVQFLGDAGSLRETLFEPDVELMRQLPQAEAIESNRGREADHHRRRLDPARSARASAGSRTPATPPIRSTDRRCSTRSTRKRYWP